MTSNKTTRAKSSNNGITQRILRVVFLPLYSVSGKLEEYIKILQEVQPQMILDTRSWPNSGSPNWSWTNLDNLKQFLAFVPGHPNIINIPELGMPKGMRPRRNETVNTQAYKEYLMQGAQRTAIESFFQLLDPKVTTLLVHTVDPVLERDQRQIIQDTIAELLQGSWDFTFDTYMGSSDRVPTSREQIREMQSQMSKERSHVLSLLRDLSVQDSFQTFPESLVTRVEAAIKWHQGQLSA